LHSARHSEPLAQRTGAEHEKGHAEERCRHKTTRRGPQPSSDSPRGRAGAMGTKEGREQCADEPRPGGHLSKGPASRLHATGRVRPCRPLITRSSTREGAPRNDADARHEDDTARPQVYIPPPGSPSNGLGTQSLRTLVPQAHEKGRSPVGPWPHAQRCRLTRTELSERSAGLSRAQQ
jgi:hypothetical protein